MPTGPFLLHNYKLLLIAIAAVIIVVCVVFWIRRKRITPEEAERRRRLGVHRQGRIIDGLITDIDGCTIHFSYAVHGVEYRAAQDVTYLQDKMPPQPHRAIGPVILKYATRNPANSIVICEEWSGLRNSNNEAI